MLKLGSTIKCVREAHGLTQRAAAYALGISDVHMCNLEHGVSYPSRRVLERICDTWGVDVYVLVWCEQVDLAPVSSRVRGPARQLALAWRSRLEDLRDHGKSLEN